MKKFTTAQLRRGIHSGSYDVTLGTFHNKFEVSLVGDAVPVGELSEEYPTSTETVKLPMIVMDATNGRSNSCQEGKKLSFSRLKKWDRFNTRLRM